MPWIIASQPARERRWNNAEQFYEAEGTRTIEMMPVKYLTNWLIDCRTSRAEMCSRAWKVTWFHWVINKINQTCFVCLEELQYGKQRKKVAGWVVDLSKRLVYFSLRNLPEFSASKIHYEVHCQSMVSDFVK